MNNVYVEKCNNDGINTTFDTWLTSCSVAECLGYNFKFDNANIMASNCKSFLAGRTDTHQNTPGFYLRGWGYAHTLTSCIAQNCNGSGFVLDNVSGANLQGCAADSNNYGSGNAADAFSAVELINAHNNIIDVTTQQTTQSGVGQIGNQMYALKIDSNSDFNDIRMTNSFGTGVTVLGFINPTSGTIRPDNSIRADGKYLTAIMPATSGTINLGDQAFRFNDVYANVLSASTNPGGTGPGLKIGKFNSPTEKIGFWGTTPISKPASANQAAVSVSGVAATDIAALTTLVNQLRQDLVSIGLIKGGA
jgi:parallel beta-helix repeat protein